MNHPTDRPVDKFGFPLPIHATSPGQRPDSPRSPRKPGRGLVLTLLLLLGAFLVLGVYSLLRSPLFADLRGKLADDAKIRAGQRLNFEDDAEGALRELNWAVYLVPDDPQGRFSRLLVRIEAGDLEGALADADRAVELAPDDPNAFKLRAFVLHCLGKHAEAVAETKKVLAMRGENCPSSLNALAYARALAKIELNEALVDVEKALTMEVDEPSQAAFLDTRGYIKHLLGDLAGAVSDLNTAINLTVDDFQARLGRFPRGGPHRRAIARHNRIAHGYLAVMYFHRGLARQAAGNMEEGEADLQLAREFGYNPAKGNF